MTQVLDVALALLNNGYTPLNVRRGSKAPTSIGWQSLTQTKERLIRELSRDGSRGPDG